MNRSGRALLASSLLLAVFLASSCGERDPLGLDVARAPVDPVVFDDDWSPDVYFQPFFQTHITAVQIDSVHAFGGLAQYGARSLKFNIPPKGSSLGLYTGGVATAVGKRDFTGFNALTFYARASEEISLDVTGFGNDNTGTSLYEAGRGGIALGQEWVQVVVPIPAPHKLVGERGLFTFAETNEQVPANSGIFPYPNGYDVWIDEIRYTTLEGLEPIRASMNSSNRQVFIGSTVVAQNTSTIFQRDGSGFIPVQHSPAYFDYTSSNTSVAVVDGVQVRVVGAGQAVINGKLGDLDVLGALTLQGRVPPAVAAPRPTLPASDVISMFSDAYADVPIDSWRAPWGGSTTVLEDYVVAGSNTKMYSSLNFVGITFESAMIDASDMTHFHLDVYAPVGTTFRVKLVSFPGGVAPGLESGDLILDATTTPAFAPGDWSILDIPLGDFVLPAGWDWNHIGQMVLSTSDAQLVLVDNVYWHR